jgi:hypothetical protein
MSNYIFSCFDFKQISEGYILSLRVHKKTKLVLDDGLTGDKFVCYTMIHQGSVYLDKNLKITDYYLDFEYFKHIEKWIKNKRLEIITGVIADE